MEDIETETCEGCGKAMDVEIMYGPAEDSGVWQCPPCAYEFLHEEIRFRDNLLDRVLPALKVLPGVHDGKLLVGGFLSQEDFKAVADYAEIKEMTEGEQHVG